MPTPPEALLLIAPGCPHCPGVLARLAERVKQGRLARLEVVNAALLPKRAAELGVRGVPWTRIGPFELQGNLAEGEIDRWIDAAAADTGMDLYLAELLEQGGLARAEALVRAAPEHLPAVLGLLEAAEVPFNVRLGASALLEGLAGSDALRALVPELARLAGHAEPRVRGDACHLLGLAGDPAALPVLEQRLEDDDPEVREIAAESIERLAPGNG
jgi:hypothetical protein